VSFNLLKEKIIDKDLCEGCGLCAGFCKAIEIVDGVAKLTGKCVLDKGATQCGLCYELCPQAHSEAVSVDMLDPLQTASVRTTDKKLIDVVSNGGFVTTFLTWLFKKKKISSIAAIVGEARSPKAITVTKASDVAQLAGTRYSPSGILDEMANVIREKGGKNVAVVGLPCELRGVKRIEEKLEVDILKIGLFCTNNNRLNKEGKIEKLGSCAHCSDFFGKHADISCGFAGSQKGYTSAIALTEKGKDLLQWVLDLAEFEIGEINMSRIEAAQKRKSTREPIILEPLLRDRVLSAVQENGPEKTATIAKHLGLTAEDIYHHLLVLQTNGQIQMIENRKDPYSVIWRSL